MLVYLKEKEDPAKAAEFPWMIVAVAAVVITAAVTAILLIKKKKKPEAA